MTREDELRSLHNGEICPCYVCHIARLKALAAKLEAENAELRAALEKQGSLRPSGLKDYDDYD